MENTPLPIGQKKLYFHNLSFENSTSARKRWGRKLLPDRIALLATIALLFFLLSPTSIFAQAPTALQDEESSKVIAAERETISNDRTVVIKEYVQPPSVGNTDSKPKFSNEIITLFEDVKKTLFKNLKCKEQFFKNFRIVRERAEELSKTLQKDLKCANLPNGFLLTAFNIYSEDKSLVDLQFFNDQITSLDLPKYQFTVRRSKETFKIRLVNEQENIRLIKGARDNAELTEITKREGFKNYAEIFLFVTKDRVILKMYVYNAESHKLQWYDYWAVEYNEKRVSFDVGLRILFDEDGLSFTSLSTSIFSHALRIMDFGFYFDFGFYSRELTGLSQQMLDQLNFRNNIHVGFSLGGLWTFNFVETILRKKVCCEFSLTARPGILIDVPIVDGSIDEDGNVVTDVLAEVNFIFPIGITLSLQNFYLAADYYPILNAGSLGVGYRF